MCGIVGYKGKQEALGVLLNGLNRLEYRGYDSAGLLVCDEQKNIHVHKSLGKIKKLEEKIGDDKMPGHIGIAHTRWATHGAPSENNAHPHSDCKNKIWVVHNGIIENHFANMTKVRNANAAFDLFLHYEDTYLLVQCKSSKTNRFCICP